MMMHKTLHPKDDIDRLYVSRKERRRGLVSIEGSVDTSIRRIEDNIKKEIRQTNYSEHKQHKDQQNNNK